MWFFTSGLAMLFWVLICFVCVGLFFYSFYQCAKNQFAKEIGTAWIYSVISILWFVEILISFGMAYLCGLFYATTL